MSVRAESAAVALALAAFLAVNYWTAERSPTVWLDEQGKPLPFKELRAGDTVYVTCTRGRAGPPVATRIRRAPMTAGELHRRYLRGVAGP